MPFAHKCFGGNCNITHCCKSLINKTTAKFSSNPTILFLRKPTRKDPPPREKWPKQSHFCPRAMGILPPPKYPRVVKQPPKNKLSPLHQCYWALLNVPLSLSRGTIFRRQKNPRRGYRPKITGISFVCNEPGRSIPYCAHLTRSTVM